MGLTGCTGHLNLKSLLGLTHLCFAGEHTYGDEETDGNRTFSEVTILTFIHAFFSSSISSTPE